MTARPIPLSLRRKSSSRVAAVQCLYRLAITGENVPPEELLADYLAHWADDRTQEPRTISRDAEPDKGFLSRLLSGVLEHKAEIDARVRASLSEKWTVERTSPLLIAILCCAIYELRYAKALKAPIIIDEYVTLTGHFFEAAEVGFVNGLLDALAKEQGAS